MIKLHEFPKEASIVLKSSMLDDIDPTDYYIMSIIRVKYDPVKNILSLKSKKVWGYYIYNIILHINNLADKDGVAIEYSFNKNIIFKNPSDYKKIIEMGIKSDMVEIEISSEKYFMDDCFLYGCINIWYTKY